jgi:copper chaperone CopZ
VLGEAAHRLLREDELAVRQHVELRASPRSDVRRNVELGGDLGCETRGPLVVAASGGAVEDLDAHDGIVPPARVVAVVNEIVFEVEQGGCESCAARIREVLEDVAPVEEVTIDEAADRATVRMAPGAALSEDDAGRLLASASEGTGHAYRVVPGSWVSP